MGRSLTISDTLITWPTDPAVSIQKTGRISQGNAYNVSELTFGSHCGTHIDAPYHFEENGIKVDQIPLDYLIGNATVFEIKNTKKIDLSDLESLQLTHCRRVIFKTINSSYWKLVGIDYLSVEKFGDKASDTHHTFLKNGVIIIEGLDLSNVNAGDYELIALPLKIKDGDGSPARVILKGI